MDIGTYLRRFREGNAMTQDHLAELMGVSRQAISKWECGESLPEIENLLFLSDLYDVSVDELLRGVKFLPKPFQIGELNLKRNLWFGFGLSLFVSMLVSGGKYPLVFIVVFVLLNCVSISLLKQGRLLVGKKDLTLIQYRSFFDRIMSVFNSKAYTQVLAYDAIASVRLSYNARVRFSPVDFGPDMFHFTIVLKDHNEYRWEVDNDLLNNLPILCDFLSKKGIRIEDHQDIVSHIIEGENIYTAMHETN